MNEKQEKHAFLLSNHIEHFLDFLMGVIIREILSYHSSQLQLLFFLLGEGILAFHLLPITAHDLYIYI